MLSLQRDAQSGELLVVEGAEPIRSLAPILVSLRARVGQSTDMLTSLEWFLSRTAMWEASPVLVLHRVGGVPASAVLFHLRCWRGFRTGVLGCGDLTGDGGVIALATDQVHAMERAVKAVLDRGLAHTAIATWRRSEADAESVSRIGTAWQVRAVHRRLDLTSGVENFLAGQSRKFRRNFRYYRRRAEIDLGCQFLPALTVEQSLAAVQELYAHSPYRVTAQRAMMNEAGIRNTPGSFAMGLVDSEGRWLSYVAGWREGNASLIQWQLNLGEQETASLSTVMRSYLVQHEAGRGATSVVFVGGTSQHWARACHPETCYDLLATRAGFTGSVLSTALLWLRPKGQIGDLHRRRRLGDPATSAETID